MHEHFPLSCRVAFFAHLGRPCVQEDKDAFASLAGATAAAANDKLGGLAQDVVDMQEFKVYTATV